MNIDNAYDLAGATVAQAITLSAGLGDDQIADDASVTACADMPVRRARPGLALPGRGSGGGGASASQGRAAAGHYGP